MSSLFDKTERVLATIAALALFTLNEFRIYQFLPHTADPAHGHIYGIWMQLFGEPATAFRLASIALIIAGIAGLKFVT